MRKRFYVSQIRGLYVFSKMLLKNFPGSEKLILTDFYKDQPMGVMDKKLKKSLKIYRQKFMSPFFIINLITTLFTN